MGLGFSPNIPDLFKVDQGRVRFLNFADAWVNILQYSYACVLKYLAITVLSLILTTFLRQRQPRRPEPPVGRC